MSCCALSFPQSSPFTRSICIATRDKIEGMALDLAGKIKYQFVGRALALGACLATLVEAVARAVILCFLALGACFSEAIKKTFIEQSQKCTQALAASSTCFATIFNLTLLSQKIPRETPIVLPWHREHPVPRLRLERALQPEPVQDTAPIRLTAVQQREFRVREGEENIRGRLEREYLHAQLQMEEEAPKGFAYHVAQPLLDPENWHPEGKQVGGFDVGICHYIGRRPTMEDEHIATSFEVNIGGRVHSVRLFGVFDGHNGPQASQYLRDNLQRKLTQTLLRMNPEGLTDVGIWNALKLTLVELSFDFLNEKREIARKQGSTATVAMILDGKLWTANVGDSRIILENGRVPIQLTEDQKPDIPRFLKGIEKRGGFMEFYGVPRLNGQLAVARAIGDYFLGDAISSRCKITMMPLHQIQPGAQLFLGCDGIWDVASTKQIARALFAHGDEPPKALAENFVYSSYHMGSNDNLSAMIVRFPAIPV